MIIPEERLLIAHLYTNPYLIPAISIDPKEFQNPTYAKIMMAYRDTEPHIFTMSLVRFWLDQRGHTDASHEMFDISQEAPESTSVDIVLTHQSRIHDNWLKRRLTTFLESTAGEAVNPDKDYNAISSSVVKVISNLSAQRLQNESQTFDDVKERALNTVEKVKWPTGMEHIDRVTGGIARGEVWILNAPYKGYKTRSALNMVLSALRVTPDNPKPKSVLYLTYDGFDTDIFYSLLSVNYDLPNHCFESPMTPERYNKWIEDEKRDQSITGDIEASRVPRRVGLNHKDYNIVPYDRIISTLEEAHQWNDVPLRIYDSRAPIHDMDLLQSLIAADKIKYDTDLVVVDYVQAVMGREYKDLAKAGDVLQQMAVTNEVAVLEISQMSNEDIKSGVDSRRLGTKGSGDFPAQADAGIEIFRSDKLIDPYEIRYVLKIARRAPKLVDQTWINPQSGAWCGDWKLMSFKRHVESSKGTDEKK